MADPKTMMNAYDARVRRMDMLCKRFDCRRPTPLVAIHRLDPTAFARLQCAARLYLSRVLKSATPILSEDEILEQFQERRAEIANVTPTGMILPKMYSTLEFNLLMAAFYLAISTMELDNLIRAWQIPMHLRVKYPFPTQENLDRPRHPPEDKHIDSWSGYSSHGITTLVPLFGDIRRNNVEFFEPLAGIDEGWLLPVPKGADRRLETFYQPVTLAAELGDVIMFDAAALHATHREKDCGMRFSIDNIFMPTIAPAYSVEAVEAARVMEQMTHTDLLTIGRDIHFAFPSTDSDHKDTLGGSIDPTIFSVVSLHGGAPIKTFF
jgi:hypothetical protein